MGGIRKVVSRHGRRLMSNGGCHGLALGMGFEEAGVGSIRLLGFSRAYEHL